MIKMEEPVKMKAETPPNACRRSVREKTPNKFLLLRQQILSEYSFPAHVKGKMQKKRSVNRNVRVKRPIEHEPDDEDTIDEDNELIKTYSQHTIKQEEKATAIKQEKEEPSDDDSAFQLPENCIVLKYAGDLCAMDKPIQADYFPTEGENSGVILFKSSSKKAILKISYPKCFVILSGQFMVEGQGIFNVGDFVKAPAGSQLSIKYLGDSNSCGRILFFKSQL